MEIKSAEFVISNTNVKKCPTGDLPEYYYFLMSRTILPQARQRWAMGR